MPPQARRSSRTPYSPTEITDLSIKIFSPDFKPPRTVRKPTRPSLVWSRLPPPAAEIDERPRARGRRFKLWKEAVPALRVVVLDPKKRFHLARFQAFAIPATHVPKRQKAPQSTVSGSFRRAPVPKVAPKLEPESGSKDGKAITSGASKEPNWFPIIFRLKKTGNDSESPQLQLTIPDDLGSEYTNYLPSPPLTPFEPSASPPPSPSFSATDRQSITPSATTAKLDLDFQQKAPGDVSPPPLTPISPGVRSSRRTAPPLSPSPRTTNSDVHNKTNPNPEFPAVHPKPTPQPPKKPTTKAKTKPTPSSTSKPKVSKEENKAAHARLLEHKWVLDLEHERRFRLLMHKRVKEVMEWQVKNTLPFEQWKKGQKWKDDIDLAQVERYTAFFRAIRRSSDSIYDYLSPTDEIKRVRGRTEVQKRVKDEKRKKKIEKEKAKAKAKDQDKNKEAAMGDKKEEKGKGKVDHKAKEKENKVLGNDKDKDKGNKTEYKQVESKVTRKRESSELVPKPSETTASPSRSERTSRSEHRATKVALDGVAKVKERESKVMPKDKDEAHAENGRLKTEERSLKTARVKSKSADRPTHTNGPSIQRTSSSSPVSPEAEAGAGAGVHQANSIAQTGDSDPQIGQVRERSSPSSRALARHPPTDSSINYAHVSERIDVLPKDHIQTSDAVHEVEPGSRSEVLGQKEVTLSPYTKYPAFVHPAQDVFDISTTSASSCTTASDTVTSTKSTGLDSEPYIQPPTRSRPRPRRGYQSHSDTQIPVRYGSLNMDDDTLLPSASSSQSQSVTNWHGCGLNNDVRYFQSSPSLAPIFELEDFARTSETSSYSSRLGFTHFRNGDDAEREMATVRSDDRDLDRDTRLTAMTERMTLV
ncbi:hypothetical protein CI109_102682 [Kwoniella shandongensis]|uniref:Uncharacterized protein n=1 Tax=Kwoniella shandongensis TaxID=1734106 RepID=A0A5M6BR31_9TREE|nr:uncharacterized protein CI109_007118 [Kwoniella shandongensis]KAA5524571.1 hypothetical protein CI109_007118 [Kwoniella shandongensis]